MAEPLKDVLHVFPSVNIQNLDTAVKVLASMITPALLISASGNFIISTSSRLGRVVDRMRELTERYEAMVKHPDQYDLYEQRFQMADWQIRMQTKRLTFLHSALNQFYICATLFVLTSIAIAMLSVFAFKFFWIPVASGILGAFFMMNGCFYMVLEARAATDMTKRETSFVHKMVLTRKAAQLDVAD